MYVGRIDGLLPKLDVEASGVTKSRSLSVDNGPVKDKFGESVEGSPISDRRGANSTKPPKNK
jgi:hypothetical protein